MTSRYPPEGRLLHTPENEAACADAGGLRRTMEAGTILEGVGHVLEDGVEYDLAAGDIMQCRDGSSHSIENRTDKPLRFLALIINVRDPA